MKTAIAILVASALIAGAIMLGNTGDSPSVDNVSVVDGTQIVEVTAKGRYSPSVTEAKAGLPTILRMKTMGTYDCTAALKVPSVGYQNMLPPTGTTDITLAPQESGAVVQGVCAMGMYNFSVKFN